MQDSRVDPDALDLAVPLDGRWPEPRLLDQDRCWFWRDRTRVDVAALDADGAARLLADLRSLGDLLHDAAVYDERLTTSSGVYRSLTALGIATVKDTEPEVWLEATVLVRALRRRVSGPGP